MVSIEDIKKKFPKRPLDAHKGDCGHVLVIAGSCGYTGAAYLTSQAALLAGSGLVTLAVGKGIYEIMASKLTEVMVRPFFETRDYSLSLLAEKDILAFSEKCSAIAIGPGVSLNKETLGLVRNIVTKATKPIILDADGINAFTGQTELFKSAKAPFVITPHPGEFARLVGKAVQEIQKDRKNLALHYANEYNTVLVLKGQNTIIADPKGEYYINETGNCGMATGGTGDVLTGLIAGFIGQGMDAFSAAVLGVHMHGYAGDLALKDKGVLSLIASDLLNKFPEVLKTLS